MAPLISVIMPVWNGEKYLAAAVESVLAQTFRDFEFIVADDGSTDATPAILRSYSDPRIRVLRLDHAGIVGALNAGLSLARGEWIARQDADDISLPHRLEAQCARLQRQPDAVLSYSGVELIADNPAKAGTSWFPRTRGFIALRLCCVCPIIHTTVLFRKTTAAAAGGYLPEERHAEDFGLWGRMLEHGDFAGLKEPLVRFRIHAQSVSKQNLDAQKAVARQISLRHCRRFLQLSEGEAERAYEALTASSRDRSWREWGWFLTRCAPRLRWFSSEACGWLLWQTAKQALRR